jgi:hypothetical protein
MEYLTRLVDKSLIGPEAVGIAQDQRDPPAHGVFGQRRADQGEGGTPQRAAGSASGSQGQGSNTEWVWDEDYQRYKYWDGRQWQWQ